MHATVREAFHEFNRRFENEILWMYLDIKGLVTVGVGNLLPTAQSAAALPFLHSGDPARPATDAEKRAAWKALRERPDLARAGFMDCQDLSDLRLTVEAVRGLVSARMTSNEKFLRGVFETVDEWPADAQLALFSMAWAMGPGFTAGFPAFTAACRQADFARAAEECRISDVGNPGVRPRNTANKALFMNAYRVMELGPERGFPRDTLYYPTVILEAVEIEGENSEAP